MSFLQKLNNLSNRIKNGIPTLSNDSKNTLWDGHIVQTVIKRFNDTTTSSTGGPTATFLTGSIIPRFMDSVLMVRTSFNYLQITSHTESNVTIKLYDNFDGGGWNIVDGEYTNETFRNYSSPSGDWGNTQSPFEWFIPLLGQNISPGKTKIEYKVYLSIDTGTTVIGNSTGHTWFTIQEIRGANYTT